MNFGKYIHGSQDNFPRLRILLNAGLPGATDHLLLTKIYFGKYEDKTKIYVSFFVVVLFCFIIGIEPHIISISNQTSKVLWRPIH